MMIYTLIFRPLECTHAVLDDVYWYKALLLSEKDKSPFILGITGLGGKLIYFEPVNEEGGRDTWEVVKKYKKMDNLTGPEHDFIINKQGTRIEINGLMTDLLF